MSFQNVGKVWSANEFPEYLKTVTPPSWVNGVCVHHTAEPSLAMRPRGLVAQHIENIRYGYINEKGWKSGPHLFTDEDQIWGMTPLREKGVHAVGFNASKIGIEMLGDFDSESPTSGRGLEVMATTAAAVRALLAWMGKGASASTVVFHREDGYTKKTCPGTLVKKDYLLKLVTGSTIATPTLPAVALPVSTKLLPVAEWLRSHGVSEADIAKNLKRDTNGMFFFKTSWLEGAVYRDGTTMAPEKELVDALAGRS